MAQQSGLGGGVGEPGLVKVGGERSLRLWTSGGEDVVEIDAGSIIRGRRIEGSYVPGRRTGRRVRLATGSWLLRNKIVVQCV